MIEEKKELSITEIGHILDLGKGTVHRILATLRSRNFVKQNPETQKYGLGIRAFKTSTAITYDEFLRNTMAPVLQDMMRRCRETVSVSVLEYNVVRYIMRMESDEPLSLRIKTGSRFPAHCTATGKALLASLSDEELKQIYFNKSAFTRMTQNSIGTLPKLMKEVREIRRTDLAEDYEEAFIGVNGVAAPVRDYRQEVLAAVGIAGPKERMTEAKMGEYAELIASAAAKITELLKS